MKSLSFIKLALVCGLWVIGLLWSVACMAAAPTVLATGLNTPEALLVDGNNVYWTEEPSSGQSGFPGRFGSISKTPGGGAVINYNYTGSAVYDNAQDFFQDTSFLYYIGLTFDGTYNGPSVCKIPKAGGASITLSPGHITSKALTLGPLGNGVYYTRDGATNLSTDSTNLYWTDTKNIWQMPLTGGQATALVSVSDTIYSIATPTTGAAAGSIFWVEGSGGTTSLKRRDTNGQITTVLAPSSNMSFYQRCFAVSDDKVFCGYTGGLVEVSINGGSVTVLAPYSPGLGPIAVATDGTFIYWSTGNQVLRMAIPGVTVTYTISTSASPGAGGSTGGGGTFNPGAGVTVVATPNGGYSFVNWTEGGNQVSATASYTFTASTNRTLVANFVLSATNANLASLVPSAGRLSPAFASGTTTYTDSVAKSALRFTVTPTVTVAGATVTVNGIPVASGSASGPIALSVGANPAITIFVTAPDGVTTKTYTVTVTRASVVPSRDWSGDAKPDLVFQNNAGQLYQWFLDGTGSALNFTTGAGLKGSGYLYTGGLGDWRVVGVGDVNGDGIPDLVFQNGVGQIYAWFLDGTGNALNFSTGAGLKGFRYLYTGGLGDWRVMGIGDVNGDGNPDLVFQNGAGQVYAWFLDGTGNAADFSTGAGLRGSVFLYSGGLGDWRVVGVGDVNGDGNPDLVFQNAAGQLYGWFLNGTGTALNFSTGAGLNGFGYLYTGGLGDWRVAGIMDVNGDNIPDLVFQNNAGQLYAWFLNGTGTAINFGTGVGLAGSVFLYTGGLGDWRVR